MLIQEDESSVHSLGKRGYPVSSILQRHLALLCEQHLAASLWPGVFQELVSPQSMLADDLSQ